MLASKLFQLRAERGKLFLHKIGSDPGYILTQQPILILQLTKTQLFLIISSTNSSHFIIDIWLSKQEQKKKKKSIIKSERESKTQSDEETNPSSSGVL